ncbi:peptidase C14, caspase domain-containing protein, partial [Coprinopsis sp. MPI-PUGE-AT-0042]
YSRCTGRRKALCIGINYKGQEDELRECIDDAKRVREFLISHGGYRPEDILMLTDDDQDPGYLPTKKNIQASMKWLVKNAQVDDTLFFHYSGHGGQTRDLVGDKADGWDEVIYPLDFRKNGHIVDRDMHNTMVKPLPRRCRLTAIFDACHSGTVLDLPYIYSSHGRLKGSHVSPHVRRWKESHADVISWSSRQDDQKSADTFHGGVAFGAMSRVCICHPSQPNQSYQGLLRSIRHILLPRFSQKPQLGSSHHIDTNLKFVF